MESGKYDIIMDIISSKWVTCSVNKDLTLFMYRCACLSAVTMNKGAVVGVAVFF